MTEAVRTMATPPPGSERAPRLDEAAEDALVRRHARGEAGAFAQLVSMIQSRIYGYLVRCGASPADRDDLFQEILVKIDRGARTHPPTGPARPWLYTITVNTVRSHFRKKKVRRVMHLDPETGAREADPGASPEAHAEARTLARWVERQIGELPLELREPLLLCAVEGLGMKEAAAVLGIPVGTVKTRLRRARLTLAEARARREVTS